MLNRKIDIIIRENETLSTVGIRFETENGFVGDYEKFDGHELTDEQIIGAVQRLMAKLLPMVPRAEEPIKAVTEGESLGKFKRTPDGKWVRA